MENFKTFEQKAWEQKAVRYQDTWGKVTTQPIQTVLRAARLKSGDTLLDCGCGGGHLCHAASQLGAGVIGCDFSEAMIRIASSHFPDLNFKREDAEELSFAGDSFDVVTLSYLLLHVSDQGRALLEAARVLKPGGRVVYTMWIPPSGSPGLRLMFDAVKKYADMTVIPPAQDIFLFADFGHAERFLTDIGFESVQFETFDTYWQVGSGENFFTAVQAGTRLGGMIDLQATEVKEKIKSDILREIEQFKTSDGYIIPTPSIIVSAVKRH